MSGRVGFRAIGEGRFVLRLEVLNGVVLQSGGFHQRVKCITSWADSVGGSGALLVVPTRPSQTSPERAAAWEHHRRRVGELIRSIRVAQGRTQEELALTSGVTRNLLIDVEYGRRGLLYERSTTSPKLSECPSLN